jgi:hypothetical protein
MSTNSGLNLWLILLHYICIFSNTLMTVINKHQGQLSRYSHENMFLKYVLIFLTELNTDLQSFGSAPLPSDTHLL